MDLALVPIAEVDMEGKRNGGSLCINGIVRDAYESGGRRFFSLLMEESQIPQYRRRVLENRCCQQLLPVHIIREKGKLRVFYDHGGFIQLKDIYKEWRRSGINLASKNITTVVSVVSAVISAENYLFSCEELSLHMDTVFIRPDTGEVRLAYIPETQDHLSVTDKIASLIKQMIQVTCDEQWTVYGEEMYDKILSCNDSISGIEKLLLEKGREICRIEWPEKSEMRCGTNNKPGDCPA